LHILPRSRLQDYKWIPAGEKRRTLKITPVNQRSFKKRDGVFLRKGLEEKASQVFLTPTPSLTVISKVLL